MVKVNGKKFNWHPEEHLGVSDVVSLGWRSWPLDVEVMSHRTGETRVFKRDRVENMKGDLVSFAVYTGPDALSLIVYREV